MALANGVLVHGPRHWACAVRTEDGSVKVASGEKPLKAVDVENRFARAPLRVAEIFPLLAEVRRRLPEAVLPFQRPGVAGAMAGSMVAMRALRRTRLSPLAASRSPRSCRSGPQFSRCGAPPSPSTTAPSTSRSGATSTASSARASTSAAGRT
jgi:hypothetical protein